MGEICRHFAFGMAFVRRMAVPRSKVPRGIASVIRSCHVFETVGTLLRDVGARDSGTSTARTMLRAMFSQGNVKEEQRGEPIRCRRDDVTSRCPLPRVDEKAGGK